MRCAVSSSSGFPPVRVLASQPPTNTPTRNCRLSQPARAALIPYLKEEPKRDDVTAVASLKPALLCIPQRSCAVWYERRRGGTTSNKNHRRCSY